MPDEVLSPEARYKLLMNAAYEMERNPNAFDTDDLNSITEISAEFVVKAAERSRYLLPPANSSRDWFNEAVRILGLQDEERTDLTTANRLFYPKLWPGDLSAAYDRARDGMIPVGEWLFEPSRRWPISCAIAAARISCSWTYPVRARSSARW
jgi:hypothetical protein